MKKVEISLGENSYDVLIGSGLLGELSQLLSKTLSDRKIALISDRNISAQYGTALLKELKAAGLKRIQIDFDSGEANKTFETVHSLYQPLIENHFERKDVVLALGGGVAGDLVGFLAATYLRGVPFVQLPTTLLAMVDASVGGKVACNHPLGKNLIGAFHQPALVVADVSTLKTLAKRELISGFAECIKHGVIGDKDLFSWTTARAKELSSGDEGLLTELVARNVSFKANIVSQDEKEQGVRALLN
ncbi:UNVERIFIED_CONTAM: hypothetical protein GTU68_047009, partial [Idotea baltica]|nr:hypothetical protein [Idotea baltica]